MAYPSLRKQPRKMQQRKMGTGVDENVKSMKGSVTSCQRLFQRKCTALDATSALVWEVLLITSFKDLNGFCSRCLRFAQHSPKSAEPCATTLA